MLNINGRTSVYGIIGNPISHTLSPMIHNTISEKMGIDSVYVPFVANDDLKSIVRGLYSLGVKGINVTVPYKTDIISELCGIDEMAASIGAVNTLKYTESGYYGYNTDILGLERELEDEGISLEGRDVILLGAGGASRAVAFMCMSGSPASITIVNRTLSKAEDIKRDIISYAGSKGQLLPEPSVEAVTFEDLLSTGNSECIVFQCTNVGLAPDNDACVLCDEGFYKKVSAGIDLIYRPARTRFMKYVEDAGGAAYNGLKMLIYQAVCAFEIWNEIKVPDQVIWDIENTLISKDG